MNSEKVKEIKKALKYAIDMGWVIGKNTMFLNIKLADIITIINELESENERLVGKVKEKVNEMTTYIVNNQKLKNRIAELEDGIAQSMLGCEFLPECTNDKLKQFAERLKEKFGNKMNWLLLDCVVKDIDETLKEFIND